MTKILTDAQWKHYIESKYKHTNIFFSTEVPIKYRSEIDIGVIDTYVAAPCGRGYSWLNNTIYLPFYYKNRYVTISNNI